MKKWIIAAAALAVVWIGVLTLGHKKTVVVAQPVVQIEVVKAKPVKPAKAKVVKRKVAHVVRPVCHFLAWEVACP